MSRPATLPTLADLAERPHATRLRYLGGCRCLPCRAANARYAAERAAAVRRGEWNGVIDAGPVRAHILALSRQGIGRRSVAEAARVSLSIVEKVRRGEKRRMRAEAARRILAVDVGARADGASVPAGGTWRLVGSLLEEGFTRTRLARELGFAGPGLQLGRERVLARTALAVERLHRRLTT